MRNPLRKTVNRVEVVGNCVHVIESIPPRLTPTQRKQKLKARTFLAVAVGFTGTLSIASLILVLAPNRNALALVCAIVAAVGVLSGVAMSMHALTNGNE